MVVYKDKMTEKTPKPLAKKIVENGMYNYELWNNRKKRKGMWDDALFVEDVKNFIADLKDAFQKKQDKSEKEISKIKTLMKSCEDCMEELAVQGDDMGCKYHQGDLSIYMSEFLSYEELKKEIDRLSGMGQGENKDD